MKLIACLRLGTVLAATALTACSGFTGSREAYWLGRDGARFPSAVESLVAYHAYAWSLTAAEWSRESDRVHESVARDPRPFQRIRYAMLAAAPAAPYPERMRAPQLLEQCEQETRNDAALKGFIALLRNELAERRRLEERAREETRRADRLDQKLGELKAIELKLLDRARPAGVQKP